jgi:L-arabinose isomerase
MPLPAIHAGAVNVQNGSWALWWPPKDASTGDLSGRTATWTTAGGAHHTAFAESVYAG